MHEIMAPEYGWAMGPDVAPRRKLRGASVANGRRGYSLPRAVKFSATDDGTYTILDHGGKAGECDRPYVEVGTILAYSYGDGRRWAIRASAGHFLSSGHETVNAAKNWYLTSRGISTAPPEAFQALEVGIPPAEWEHAEEWRAKVWRLLLRRNRAPSIDRLLTPVGNSSGFLIFRWPVELAQDWQRYRLTTV